MADPHLDQTTRAVATRWATTIADPARLEAGDPTLTYKAQPTGAGPRVSLTAANLELEREIGRGGTASIWRARQRSLDRQIAVKVPLSAGGHRPLIAEAVVTGALEHPNIIPVHGLAADASGAPTMSMKLVRGAAWADQLDGSPLRGAALEAQLQTLVTVCNAVAFAHSRGLLHLDLKPENVMIGDFGEVLLVDWGLAASIDPAQTAAPPAASIDVPNGTPAYMAPEMALSEGQRFGPWTDVYLLGAILHQLLTGLPPHRGKNVLMALSSAAAAEPSPRLADPKIPGALARICRRALAREPAQRFQSALGLGRALAGFRAQRQSMALARQASQKAGDAVSPSASGIASGRSHELYSTLAEAQAGFRQALQLWPRNREAEAELHKTTARYAEAALRAADLGLARSQLESLPDKARPRALATRVEQASREAARRQLQQRRTRLLARGLVAAAALAALVAAILSARERGRALEASEQATAALADRQRIEREAAAQQATIRREAEQAVRAGQRLLAGAQAAAEADREPALVEAEAAFRRALLRVPDDRVARAGLRRASLARFDIALARGHWRQAREKLLEARLAGLDEEAHASSKARLLASESARQRQIEDTVDWLINDARRGSEAGHRVPLEVGVARLLAISDPITVKALLAFADSDIPGVQRLVFESVAWMEDRSAVPVLLRYTEPRRPDGAANPDAVRESAVRGLCILADPAVFERVQRLILAGSGLAPSRLLRRVGPAYSRYVRAILAADPQPQRDGWDGARWLARGKLHVEARQWGEAVRCLTRAVELGAPPQALVLRARAYQRSARIEQALADYGRALERDPDDLPALLGRADLLQHRHELEAALRDLDRACQLRPDLWIVRLRRAEVLMYLDGPSDRSHADLMAAQAAAPDVAEVWALRGMEWVALNRLGEARQALARARKLDPMHAEVWASEGRMFLRAGATQQALVTLNKACELDPTPSLVLDRAGVKVAAGDIEGALHDVEAVLAQDPGQRLALWTRASIRMLRGEFRPALADLERALPPSRFNRWQLDAFRALAHEALGERREAAAALGSARAQVSEAILERFLSRRRTHMRLVKQGRPLLGVASPTPAQRLLRGQYLHSVGRGSAGERDIEAALRAQPGLAGQLAHRELIRYSLEYGDWAAALAGARRWARLHPQDADAQLTLAQVALRSTNMRAADSQLAFDAASRAVALRRDWQSLAALGQATFRLGDRKGARALIGEAIARYPPGGSRKTLETLQQLVRDFR